jgi:S1-C subfamily serine protease
MRLARAAVQAGGMGQELVNLSNSIASAVAKVGAAVVAVNARQRIASSGVCWRPGVIVTAEHTIRREEEITVTLPDGRPVPATLAGRDPGTDLAVLKADSSGLATLEPAPADEPRPGQIALVVGRGGDTGVNASMGVVSAVAGPWRTWRGGMLDRFIRLDAALYPGSSGGAVVDVQGRALGIATGGLSRIAGIAIPSSTVSRIAEQLLSSGRVARGYLGVGLQPVVLGGDKRGLIILNVEPGGPADKAGLLVGDILTAAAGRALADTDDMQAALGTESVGQPLELALMRGGAPASVTVTVAERPRREA